MDGASGRQATGSRTQTPAKVVIPAAVAAAAAMGLAFSHAVGILPVGLYTTDYVFLAEGAGRIALGQMPHVDFSAPVGPLVFALFALARRLPVLGPDLFAVNLLMWAIVAVPAAIVAARLRAALPALAFLGIAALVTLAPFNLEEMTGICEVNHNGIYNRHGAALLFVTFVAGLTRPRAPALDGALFAFLVAAMLLTKVTYGVAGVAFIAVACLFSAARLRAAAVAALLLAVAAVALEATTGLVSAYARDLAAMARLNAGGVAAYLRSAVWSHALVLLVAVGLMAALARAPLQAAIREARTGSAAEAWRSLETPVLAAACLLLTLWTESQSTGGAGLVGLSALAFAPSLARSRCVLIESTKTHERDRFQEVEHDVLAERGVHVSASFSEGRRNDWSLALAVGLVLLTAGWFADQVLRRGWCLVDAAREYRSHPALDALVPGLRVSPGRLDAAELAARLWRDHRPLADEAYRSGFDFHLESYGAPVSFVANALLAHEAVGRLRALGLESGLRHATTLNFVDDFSPRLALPPAPGTKLALDPYRTIGPLSKAEAAAYLAPIDAAFERTCAAPLHARQIADFFRPTLEEAFTPVVLTPCWTVHLRSRRVLTESFKPRERDRF